MITITGKIKIGSYEIELNKKNIISIDINNIDRASLNLPSFGIISNQGNVSFNDNDKLVLRLANSMKIKNSTISQFFLENTLTKTKKQIAEYDLATWDYEVDNRVVNLTLKDNLEEWQEININGFNYDPRNPKSKSLKDIYIYLQGETPTKYNMLTWEELGEATGGETTNFLANKYVEVPFLLKDNLWSSWDKFCQVSLSHIYKENGKTILRYNGGN